MCFRLLSMHSLYYTCSLYNTDVVLWHCDATLQYESKTDIERFLLRFNSPLFSLFSPANGDNKRNFKDINYIIYGKDYADSGAIQLNRTRLLLLLEQRFHL